MEGLASAAGCSAVTVLRQTGDRVGFKNMVANVRPWQRYPKKKKAPTLTTYTHSSPNTHTHTQFQPTNILFSVGINNRDQNPGCVKHSLSFKKLISKTHTVFPTHAFTSPLSIFLPISLPPTETTWKHWTPLLLLFLTVMWFLHWTHIFFPLALIISTGLPTQLLTFEPTGSII